MPTTRPSSRLPAAAALAALLLIAGCARKGGCTGDYCGTLVIAGAGEPDILVPPVTSLSPSRDARFAHGRVPVPAALSRDVLRRGVPHAHHAVPPVARGAAEPVAHGRIRTRAGGRRTVSLRRLAVGREPRAGGRFHILPRPSPPAAPRLAFHARPAGRRDPVDRG